MARLLGSLLLLLLTSQLSSQECKGECDKCGEGQECEEGECEDGHCGDVECEEGKLQQIQGEFNQCFVTLNFAFEDGGNEAEDSKDSNLCQLFSSTMESCGKVLYKCHTRKEVMRMMDMQLETMMVQFREFKVEECEAVQEYLSSGRRETNISPGMLCSDSQTVIARQQFQECSHSASSKTYRAIADLTDGQLIVSTLCGALQTIATDCLRSLVSCFSEEDIRSISVGHLDQMRQFLVGIAEEKVESDSLDSCEVEHLVVEEEEEGNNLNKEETISPVTELWEDLDITKNNKTVNESVIIIKHEKSLATFETLKSSEIQMSTSDSRKFVLKKIIVILSMTLLLSIL